MEKIVNIQKEIEKILWEEYDKVIQENKDNFLIKLLIEDKLNEYSINDLIQKINGGDKPE